MNAELNTHNALPAQIASTVIGGGRLEVPPPEQLPGPHRLSPAAFEAYCRLMR